MASEPHRRRWKAAVAAAAAGVVAVSGIAPRTPQAPAGPPPRPLAANDPVVALAGDIACDPASSSFNGGLGTHNRCRQAAVADLMPDGRYAAVLPVGDTQYEDATLKKFLGSYALSWGRLKDITRPVPGNHEYRTPGAAGYFDYFGAAAGRRSRGYYSFDVGAWHVVALNSNCAAVGGCGTGSPQKRWLRADLEANTSRCTLAYWHHPRFSSGRHGNTTAVAPLYRALYRAGADVVVAGHDHSYERFARLTPRGTLDRERGIRSFVVGTGGKEHYEFPDVKPHSRARNADTFGVLELVLRPRGYDWRFVPEAGKSFTDTGSASCH